MKICMAGAGALGSAIGGALAQGGHDVTCVDPFKAHMDAIAANGLRVASSPEAEPGSVPVRARTSYAGLPPQDLIIVLVKSFATREAARQAKLAGIIGPETVVLTIQNGIGNEEALIEELGEAYVISGKTFVSGLLLEPGKVMAAVAGRPTVIGEMNGSVTPRIERIAAALSRGGLETRVSPNIVGMAWDKLLVNVATGALSGVTGLPYGGLYAKYGHDVDPGLKATALAAINEAMAVAGAKGIALSGKNAEAVWDSAAEGQPESFKASILQSLERGIATEVDFINGAVSREGKKSGVPTPVNDTLTACIHGIEQRMGVR